jgi:Holliday junction resolvase
MRRAAKVDENQARIVAALRSIGCSVQTMHGVGDGVPDLLAGTHGLNILIEVKDGKKSPSKRKLTGPQVDWISDWRGSVKVVENVEQAIAAVNSAVERLTP